ncbi:MAG: hypothetical protein QOH35_2341, partial [Acidobacteriaceae bacterium]|nr:hypothetical protein [Acidobacteriaceae bacterium]
MAGDFGKIAEHTTAEAELFVDTLGIHPAMQVLD